MKVCIRFTCIVALTVISAAALADPPASAPARGRRESAARSPGQRANRRPSSSQPGSADGQGRAEFMGNTVVRVGQPWAGDLEFTVGPGGIARGGGIRIFTPPTAWGGPPELEGAIHVLPAPASKPRAEWVGKQVLGWIVVITFPDGPLAPGSRIRFHYSTRFVQKYSEPEVVWPVESDVDGDGAYALLEEKSLPRVQVSAGPAARLRIGAPSVMEPGKGYVVRILVMDDLNNPVEQDFPEPVSVTLADESASLAIKGSRGQTTLRAPATEGLYHLTARAKAVETCLLPVKVTARQVSNLYWGLLHAHTGQSDGLGTLDEYYTYGRDVGFLDFCAANDHALPLKARGAWQAYIAAADRYNEPGQYATLVGYEWTSEGHRNLYFATADSDLPLLTREDPADYDEFVARLKQSGKRVIIGKHTAHPLDTRRHDPGFERLVEIQSMWGTSEYPGCPGWTKGGDRYVPAASGQTILGSGHHVGFVGGGDSHSGRPGRNWFGTRWGPLLQGREGQTAVLAPELTREAIFNALDHLHSYATSGPRILVDFRAGVHVIGDQIPVGESAEFAIDVGGAAKLARVELLRDNYVIAVREPKALIWSGTLEDTNVPAGEHWYYLRVTQTDGERAWTTPIWATRR
jgi:hypothetical protein